MTTPEKPKLPQIEKVAQPENLHPKVSDVVEQAREAIQNNLTSQPEDRGQTLGDQHVQTSFDAAELGMIDSSTKYHVARREELASVETFSETIKDNPRAKLSFINEYGLFFKKLEQSDPERVKLVKEISNEINFDPDTQSIVAIPCYVREKKLAPSLENYLNQTNQQFEIVICFNAGKTVPKEEFKAELEKRKSELEELKKQHPNLKIHTFTQYYPEEKTRLGNVRALLAEVICRSSKEAGLKDPVIISNDSDSLELNEGYVGGFLRNFNRHPDLDYANGQVEWDTAHKRPDSLSKKIPELLIGQRIWQIAQAIKACKYSPYGQRDIGSWGANMAYRASSYMACGGYDVRSNSGEDTILGERLKYMRYAPDLKNDLMNKNYQRLSPNSKLQTSPRRALNSILNRGGTFSSQWERFDDTFGADLDDESAVKLYKQDSHFLQCTDIEAASGGNKEASEKIKNRIQFILKKFLLEEMMDDVIMIKHLLHGCGIKTTLPPDQWKFTYDKDNNLVGIDNFEIDADKSAVGFRYLFNYYLTTPKAGVRRVLARKIHP